MRKIVVVNRPEDWPFHIGDASVVAAKTYLTDSAFLDLKNLRVFNLCRSYKYQATGYYVSLLAEARGHKVIPSVTTIQDLKSQAIIRVMADDVDDMIQRGLGKLKSNEFMLSIYFGRNVAKQYDALSQKLYNIFPAPLMRAEFVRRQKRWELQNIFPIPVNAIPDSHREYVIQFAEEHFKRQRFGGARKKTELYDLAILVNPEEKSPPSNKKAIEKFSSLAEDLGFYVNQITKDDFGSIAEYDALFIRETTAVHHHTYRFARRAAAEGLVVIDDPLSILRCTNKVYLAEVLAQARIPTPRTMIIHRDNADAVAAVLGLPCVLKQPDSSFSLGVVQARDERELKTALAEMLDHSDMIIGQEFLPTDYDWRIGVLDRKPLFACRYMMAKGHWQIYNWAGANDDQYGGVQCVPLDEVPKTVISQAVRSANIIGDGLYGVDLKQVGKKVYVIEVNDNPSIDHEVEDSLLGDEIYLAVLWSIQRRIEALRNKKNGR